MLPAVQEATTQILGGSPGQPTGPQAEMSRQTPGTPSVVAQSASDVQAVQTDAVLVQTFWPPTDVTQPQTSTSGFGPYWPHWGTGPVQIWLPPGQAPQPDWMHA